MVRKAALRTRILSGLAFSFALLPAFTYNIAHATCVVNNGVTECDEGANFEVKIPEILTVQITRPNSWATGDIGEFLRNTITLDVTSNNPAGFTASMTSNSTTTAGAALSNPSASSTIPMLTTSWTRSNTSVSKFWGYSVDDANESGTYDTIALKNAASPSILIPSGTIGTASKDIYFGAKADSTIDSGTYSGTVIISVVSGTITNDNPVTPVDPATKTDTTTNNPAYESGDPGRTIYTATTYDGTENTSTVEVSEGDTRDSYSDPAGVTTATVNEGTPLATGLAATAVVAAVAGVAFFVAARRREEEDDDEY